jgi:hypothetical protein
MNATMVSCSKCTSPLPGEIFNLAGLAPCPSCGQQLEVAVFPALFQRLAPGQVGESILEESESSCFYHPQKKAVRPCDACGRFLCALCDCELDGRHFCPACLDTGKKKGKITSLENHRVLYDSVALTLALLPVALVITFYFTFVTAPLALFFAIRYWNTPTSVIRRTKVRFVLAIIFASVEILVWIVVIGFAVTNHS